MKWGNDCLSFGAVINKHTSNFKALFISAITVVLGVAWFFMYYQPLQADIRLTRLQCSQCAPKEATIMKLQERNDLLRQEIERKQVSLDTVGDYSVALIARIIQESGVQLKMCSQQNHSTKNNKMRIHIDCEGSVEQYGVLAQHLLNKNSLFAIESLSMHALEHNQYRFEFDLVKKIYEHAHKEKALQLCKKS